jgi:hypothetical protein
VALTQTRATCSSGGSTLHVAQNASCRSMLWWMSLVCCCSFRLVRFMLESDSILALSSSRSEWNRLGFCLIWVEEAGPAGHAAVSGRRRRQRRVGIAAFVARGFAPRRPRCFSHLLLHSYSVFLCTDSSSVSSPSTRTASVVLFRGYTPRRKRIGPWNRRCE